MSIDEGVEISKLSRPPHKDSNRKTYQGILNMTETRALVVARSGPIVTDFSKVVPSGKTWLVRVRIDIVESDA